MAVFLSPVGGVAAQFFDNSGNVLTGGKIYTYAAGTTTPQVTYTSAAGATFHSNPIILDAAGRVPGGEIWLADGLSYKFVIKDANEVLIGTYDNIIGINSNFLNYAVQEEIQTATAGQNVFTLSTITYQPGTNTLQVFVDGVNQYDGISYAYVETNSTTVTFTAGLHVGALVKFTTAVSNSSGSSSASLITFTGFNGQTGVVQDLADDDGSDWIGFLPAGTGAVAVSAQEKMRENVSAQDFGAVGDGVTDDTVAIQKFFDYIQANNVGTAYCNGNFAISSGVIFGNAGEALTKNIVGNATFIALNAIDTMLTFKTALDLVWNGKITVLGTGSNSYVSRTCRIGITIGSSTASGTSRTRFGGLIARYFSYIGINAISKSTLTDFGNVRVSDCGSGLSLTNYSLLANWSGRVDTGTTGSTGQRTTINVDQMPPAGVGDGTYLDPGFVVINGETYYIYSRNDTANTISVYPWIDLNLVSGSLRYLFGGGVRTIGGDAGIQGFNQIDAVRCSMGLFCDALYGPVVNRFVTQYCGVGFAFGGYPSNAMVSFQLNGFYCENNDYDIMRVTRAAVGGMIASSYALNFEKFTYTCDSRSSANTYANIYNNMNTVAIYQNGILNRFQQLRRNQLNSSSTLSLDVTSLPLHNQYKRNSWTVNLVRPNLANNDAFGYNSDTVTMYGTGASYEPTGTITFVAPTSTTVNTTGSGAIGEVVLTVANDTGILRYQDVTGTGIAVGTYVVRVSGDVVILSQPLTATISSSVVTFSNTVATTVNGGATAAFSGFTKPVVFTVYYDYLADNFIVSTV